MSRIPSVTDATFEREVLAAPGTTLVEFWAEWCGPCRALAPILEQVSDEHGLRVVKINADENMASAVAYKALALPVMTVFRDGELVKTIVGAKPKPALVQELTPFL